jgi:D-lactate dehydrogenase
MLYFPGIFEACASIVALRDCGAEALELMDRASLRSVEHLPGLPDFFNSLPEEAAALLCEFQANSPESLEQLVTQASKLLRSLPLLHGAHFTTEEYKRTFYWKLRKGMFPSVGAVRKRGTTVILEDVTFPVDKLAYALLDLKQLFVKFEYDNAIIFGHAKDGNIHFVITQLLDTSVEVHRYDAFMREVVELVLKKYDGALKGEHGTGRNMAPFVEAEWGGDAFRMMQQIKKAADPMGLLNPGVIINASENAHIENLKDLPQVEEEVDKCIECGFCEVNCPSRDVTMTPRRRIVARRALQRLKKEGKASEIKQLQKEYIYDGLDTCATDGLCATDCPVDINTGELVKRLRHENHGALANRIAAFMSRHYGFIEKLSRMSIGFIAWLDNLAGMQLITKLTRGLHKYVPAIPVWLHQLKGARRLPKTSQGDADYLFFTSCINRVMESNPQQEKTLQQTLLSLSQKAGIKLVIPLNISGSCCGQPFSSKGFFEAGNSLLEKTIDNLLVWTNNGQVPVVCDFSSCTYTFIQNAKRLSPGYYQQFSQLQFVDSVAFIHDIILPRIILRQTDEKVVLHPTCAVTKMKLNQSLLQIANKASSDVLVPAHAGCCGMAGDRGFLVPELTAAAAQQELDEVKELEGVSCYASATTCEISLSNLAGKPYKHIAYLVDALS